MCSALPKLASVWGRKCATEMEDCRLHNHSLIQSQIVALFLIPQYSSLSDFYCWIWIEFFDVKLHPRLLNCLFVFVDFHATCRRLFLTMKKIIFFWSSQTHENLFFIDYFFFGYKHFRVFKRHHCLCLHIYKKIISKSEFVRMMKNNETFFFVC